jgi:AraC-like DNA-binding protein
MRGFVSWRPMGKKRFSGATKCSRNIQVLRRSADFACTERGKATVNVSDPDPKASSAGTTCPPPVMRFSTDMFPERERVAAWRDFFGLGLLRVEIDPMGGAFHSDATLRALPGLGVVAGTSVGMRFNRARHLIDNDDALFVICFDGESRYSGCGRETVIRGGDAIMMGVGEAGISECPGYRRYLSMRLSTVALSSTVRRPGDLVCRRIPAQTPALQLLVRYVELLDDDQALATPALQRQVVTHIHDVAALALGATGDAAEIANGRGVRAARLHAIKKDVAADFLRGDVSVGAIATRHGVTPRYVQKLFDDEGTTFTEFVLTQRLARAYRMLSDPRHAGKKLAAMAYEVGFNDPSYFFRRFRRQYGMAPSEVREAALNADGRSSSTAQ